MKTFSTIFAMTFLTNFAFSQYFDIEYSADSTLDSVSIYFVFQDSITKRPDSILYQTKKYNHGLLKSSESIGQPGYRFVTEYYYYPNSINLHRSVNRTMYHGQDSASSVAVIHYDNDNHKFFTLHYDSSSQGEFVRYEFFHNKYNDNGQIELQYSIFTNGPGYSPSTTIYQYDKYGNILRELITNNSGDEDTMVIFYTNQYNSNNQLSSTKRMTISSIHDYRDGKEIIINRDTTENYETKYVYNEQGQKFQEIYFIKISDKVVRNPGQTFQKDIREYYYYPNGQFKLKKHIMTIDRFGEEMTTEYRAYYNYKK